MRPALRGFFLAHPQPRGLILPPSNHQAKHLCSIVFFLSSPLPDLLTKSVSSSLKVCGDSNPFSHPHSVGSGNHQLAWVMLVSLLATSKSCDVPYPSNDFHLPSAKARVTGQPSRSGSHSQACFHSPPSPLRPSPESPATGLTLHRGLVCHYWVGKLVPQTHRAGFLTRVFPSHPPTSLATVHPLSSSSSPYYFPRCCHTKHCM